MKSTLLFMLTIIMILPITANWASGNNGEYLITIRDHRFKPRKLTIPSNTKVNITVKNLDDTDEEFESHDLDLDKMIKAKSEITLRVGPLKPGKYKFVGEFHPRLARGYIVVE